MHIKYSNLPGFQNLFLDYLYEFENVEKFYKLNFRDSAKYASRFESISSYERDHRSALVKIINDQYDGLKQSKQTKSNIQLLASSNTLAVVTGQQLGLMGGPLYTIYKTITALKLCINLKEKYHDFNFTPVFWMEGDDHDFDEITRTNIFNKKNELAAIMYDDGLGDEINRGSVGPLDFNTNIDNVLSQLSSELKQTEYTDAILELFQSIYNSGKSFKVAFRELMHYYFDEYGLVIIDPNDVEIKKLLKPIFLHEIENFHEHTESILECSAELDELYHAQVKIKPINLFLSENDGRYLIEPVEDTFRLRGKRKRITKDEMLAKIEESPELFSPNVLLRPICQDYLLPTAFYIAGPSEISYFAQVIPNYNFFNIEQPYIYPRSSVTIIENQISSLLQKYNLSLLDILISDNELNSKIINSLSEVNLDDIFNSSQKEMTLIWDSLKENMYAIDKTLIDAINKSDKRSAQSLDVLKSKAQAAQERKHETVIRQLNKIKSNLYPNNNYQERELNFIHYANKYGLDIMKWIYNEMSINMFEHQIIEM